MSAAAAVVVALASLLTSAAPGPGVVPGARYDAAFSAAWFDGNAEVSTYALTRQRYGETRSGEFVAVVVSEPWSASKMVKDDDATGADRIDVLKLHTTAAFQTGIYDYHIATSTFVNLKPLNGMAPGNVIKIAFSAQEWCGQTYSEYTDDGRAAQELVRSYFANESQTRAVSRERGPFLVEESLLLWARGLAGPLLTAEPLVFQPALERARLLHKPTLRAAAAVKSASETVAWGGSQVPASRLRVTTGSDFVDVVVEQTAPHRVLLLQTSDGTSLKLVKSVRLPYWQLHGNKDAPERLQLGLAPVPAAPSVKP